MSSLELLTLQLTRDLQTDIRQDFRTGPEQKAHTAAEQRLPALAVLSGHRFDLLVYGNERECVLLCLFLYIFRTENQGKQD